MGNTKQHGYEMFLYRIRGYVKNVKKSGSQTIFNIEPSSLHISGMQINGVTHPAITLIGHRLIKTAQGMKSDDDVFGALQSVKFVCTNVPANLKDGDYHEFHIEEAEAIRIKPLMADPNLVVKVAGIL